MSDRLALALLGAACAASGVWLVATALGQPVTSLDAAIRRVRRAPATNVRHDAVGVVARVGRSVIRSLPGDGLPWAGSGVTADLAVVGRRAEVHAAVLCAAALIGLVAPSVVLGLALLVGVASPSWYVPITLALLGGVCGPLALQADLRTRARQQRRDLRHQLSAFLDVVTMLLAGNVGNEGALRHAATVGDGRLFVELRRRMTEAETAGRPMVDALGAVGRHLQITELQQIAASASLASSEGAPVSRSLTAKCATLRSSLAAEDEAAARVRTGKLSLPLVGMGLLIMALVIYPALNVRP